MHKKTPYSAYYFATVHELTPGKFRSMEEIPLIDVSETEKRMQNHSIEGISCREIDYPNKIADKVSSPPAVIFYQGDLSLLQRPILGIVGPRRITSYGERCVKELFEHLSPYCLVTISGMARGTDTLCHELSVEYNIPTIAVLGGGIGHFLRSSQRTLMKKIVDGGGLVISEYKHHFAPTDRSFPQRNRIVAGLSHVLFLPEAQEKSGSLISADIAYEKNIPVFAPMQDIFIESSRGTNTYIGEGKIIPLHEFSGFLKKHFTRAEHVEEKEKTMHVVMTSDEEKIMHALKAGGERSFEDILHGVGMSMGALMMVIAQLEMKGVIVESSPGMYRKK